MSGTSYSLTFPPSSSSAQPRQPLSVLDLLAERRYACDECECEVLHDQPRYHCSRCRDFDLCARCRATTAHAHSDGEAQPVWSEVRLWPEPTTAPVAESASFAAAIDDAFVRFGERPCVGQRTQADDAASAAWLTYGEMRGRVHACSAGLARRIRAAWHSRAAAAPSVRFCHCTVNPRPCVAIWAANCVDWLVADLACHLQHYVVVPVDHNTPAAEALSILRQMEVSAIFVDSSTLSRFAPLAAALTTVHAVVVINASDLVMSASVPNSPHVAVLSIEEVERAGVAAPPTEAVCEARADCVVSVMYTSGSTGEAGSAAKGVLITDSGFCYRSGSPMRGHDVRHACYLPLSNSTSRAGAMRCLSVGGAVGVVQSPACFLADLAWIQPTSLSCPPRMWTTLHATYSADLEHALTYTPALGRARDEVREEAEAVAMGRFRARLGGRVSAVSTGGAKSPSDLLHFLTRCFGAARAHDSYGATECGSIARGGYILPGVEVALLDVPALGFTASDLPWPRGELCVASRNMAAGYTSAALFGAFIRMHERVYYRTGDVVELRRGNGLRGEGDQVKVLDRVSNVVKLSNGLFVSPETIEHALELHCPHIEHLLLHAPLGGDSLLAVLVPRASAPRWSDAEWMEQLGRVADEHRLPNYCKPAAVYVDRSGVSWQKQGLLAAQEKKRRAAALLRYRAELDKLTSASATSEGVAGEDVEMTVVEEHATPQSLRDRLKAILLSHLPGGTIDFAACAEKGWLEAGGDSMGAIAAAHSLGLVVPNRSTSATQILSATSLHSLLLSLLADEQHEAPSNATAPIDWSAECSLPPSLRQSLHAWPAAPQSDHSTIPTVLLTGATGFLGCFVLAELMAAERPCRVVCIVRATSPEAATSRLARSLMQFSIAPSESAALSLLSSRGVSVEVGDAAAERFGLSTHCYAALQSSVSHVIHNAARVNFVLPYAALRRDNVQSTLEALRFCSSGGRTTPLCYVSTASTERCTMGNVGRGGHGGYAQSKFVSEQLVMRAARELGVLACVVRPTSIIGHSVSGAGPADASRDLLSAVWLGIARVGRVHLLASQPVKCANVDELTWGDVLPLLVSERGASAGRADEDNFRLAGVPLAFNVVPVDYVARVVVQSTFLLPSSSSSPTAAATMVRACNPRGSTSCLSLLLASDLPLDTPVVVGEEAEREWRLLVSRDRLPPVMRAFRQYLTASHALTNSVEAVDGAVESDCPVVDLPLLRRCYHRLASTC